MSSRKAAELALSMDVTWAELQCPRMNSGKTNQPQLDFERWHNVGGKNRDAAHGILSLLPLRPFQKKQGGIFLS